MHQRDDLTLEKPASQECSVTRVSFHANPGYRLHVTASFVPPPHLSGEVQSPERITRVVPFEHVDTAIKEIAQVAASVGVLEQGGCVSVLIQRERAP